MVENKAIPFIKWVGGKRGIMSELLSRIPKTFNDYYEVFLGGGALYYELFPIITNAYLSDYNDDLITTYNVVKDNPENLIKLLNEHKDNHSDEYYYKIRSNHNQSNPFDIAARFIYLNKTCFNGLYRVNKGGEFNVPVGKYNNPNISDKSNLSICSVALGKAQIESKDFTSISPGSNDFVYFDPPYDPINKTSFTSYSKIGFGDIDQIRLRDFIISLNNKGVKIMLSNSNTEFINELYSDDIFNIGVIKAPRSVSCNVSGRKSVGEVIIRNYL